MLAWVAGIDLGHCRQDTKDDGTDERGKADEKMKSEADDEIKRNPRQVEQRNKTRPRKKRTEIGEVAQRLQSFATISRFERQAHHAVIDARTNGFIEVRPDAHENAASDQIEDAQRPVHERSNNDECDKCRDAA